MIPDWWTTMDTGFKTLFTLFGLMAAFLGGGKLIRINRADVASTNSDIAATKAEEVASNSITAEVARLSAEVTRLSTLVREQGEQIQVLRSELGHVNSGRATALKVLGKIDLCSECTPRVGVLVEAAIAALEETDDASHGH